MNNIWGDSQRNFGWQNTALPEYRVNRFGSLDARYGSATHYTTGCVPDFVNSTLMRATEGTLTIPTKLSNVAGSVGMLAGAADPRISDSFVASAPWRDSSSIGSVSLPPGTLAGSGYHAVHITNSMLGCDTGWAPSTPTSLSNVAGPVGMLASPPDPRISSLVASEPLKMVNAINSVPVYPERWRAPGMRRASSRARCLRAIPMGP